MKKKFALLLCSTGNEAFAVGNVIIGAKKYLFQNLKDEEYDVVFYTDKLEKNDENALKKIFPRIIIRIYKPPFSISDNISDITYYTAFAYTRFEIFDMLDYINILLLKKAKNNIKYTDCIKIVENTKRRITQNANYDMSIDNMLFNMWEEVV